ncbi:major histocompatibility complex class I-related gene protein-like [Pundamilia nyererei]|uniref:Major histocompatibility complex class I-related gene protein-like n=1 Tax=Pundamilia nyererei TaxID=303518 RepID=A0A9Y3RZD3_9CICH|nr:PREDICTED: major histocompatibility complex class I-related gene protein-like [Pundamilia nyererei]
MVVKLVILFLLCHTASAVSHSLKYLVTGSSGDPNISELMYVAVVDDTEVLYCDASKKIVEPRQDWVKKMFDDNPDMLLGYTHECFEHQPIFFKSLISNWKQLLNQNEGVHILQSIIGCNVNENSGEVSCFLQFGFNGEGIFEFDPKTKTIITLKPELQISEQMLNDHRNLIKYVENLFSMFHPKLKIFLDYGSSSLNKKVPPSVSLLQKTFSSPVSCHATGFYPDRAVMLWKKDGVEIHDGVDLGEIIPNNDGTFQTIVELNVSSVTPEDWNRYDCVFELSGVRNIITKLDRTRIRSNRNNPSDTTAPVIAIVVALLIFIIIAAVGFAVYKKKKAPENSTEVSVRLNQETSSSI